MTGIFAPKKTVNSAARLGTFWLEGNISTLQCIPKQFRSKNARLGLLHGPASTMGQHKVLSCWTITDAIVLKLPRKTIYPLFFGRRFDFPFTSKAWKAKCLITYLDLAALTLYLKKRHLIQDAQWLSKSELMKFSTNIVILITVGVIKTFKSQWLNDSPSNCDTLFLEYPAILFFRTRKVWPIFSEREASVKDQTVYKGFLQHFPCNRSPARLSLLLDLWLQLHRPFGAFRA